MLVNFENAYGCLLGVFYLQTKSEWALKSSKFMKMGHNVAIITNLSQFHTFQSQFISYKNNMILWSLVDTNKWKSPPPRPQTFWAQFAERLILLLLLSITADLPHNFRTQHKVNCSKFNVNIAAGNIIHLRQGKRVVMSKTSWHISKITFTPNSNSHLRIINWACDFWIIYQLHF